MATVISHSEFCKVRAENAKQTNKLSQLDLPLIYICTSWYQQRVYTCRNGIYVAPQSPSQCSSLSTPLVLLTSSLLLSLQTLHISYLPVI